MSNQFVINNKKLPLYTQMTNTYITPGVEASPESDAAKSNALFMLTTGSASPTSGQNLFLQMTNPSGSGKTVYVSQVLGGSTAAATLNIYSSGTITGGTTPAAFNLNFASAVTSVVTTKQNNSTLGGTPTNFFSMPVTSGEYSVAVNGGIIVTQNKTITFSLGAGALTGSINVLWWEY